MWQQPASEFRRNNNNSNNDSVAMDNDDGGDNFGYADSRNYQSSSMAITDQGRAAGWKNDREASSFRNSSRYTNVDFTSDVDGARNFTGPPNIAAGGAGVKYRGSPRGGDRKDDGRKRRRHRSSRSYSRSRSRSRSKSRSRSRGSTPPSYYNNRGHRKSPRDDFREGRGDSGSSVGAGGRYHKDRRGGDEHRSWRDNNNRRGSPPDAYENRGSGGGGDNRRRHYDGSRERNSSRGKDDWLSHVWSEGYREEILEIDRHHDQHNHHHHRGDQYYQDRRSYKAHSPNRTIILRGLATHITEDEIREQVVKTGVLPKDVRLIKKKDTGSSRGFAFIEFHNVDESKFVMNAKEGQLKFADNYKIAMQYSIQKDQERDTSIDWYCRCSALNFKRREQCYRCGSERKLSECTAESDEISTHPTHTVILKGLAVSTTEEGVLKAIQSSSSLPIRNVRIGRDKLSNTSRGICYLEMNNVSDAMYLHNTLLADKLTIDGKQVMVLYSKLSCSSSGNGSNSAGTSATGSVCKAGDAAVAAAQWSHQKLDLKSSSSSSYTLSDVPQLAEYSANLYAKCSPDRELYVKHYTDYYKKIINEGGTVPSLDTSASNPTQTGFNSSTLSSTTAVTTSASSTPTLDGNGGGNNIGTVMMACAEPPSGDGEQTYPVPDVSTYQYDKTSGYYYDPFTTLYYDSNSQYYYNSKLNKFLYWDGFKKTFLSATSPNESSTAGSNTTSAGTSDTTSDTNAAVISAKPKPATVTANASSDLKEETVTGATTASNDSHSSSSSSTKKAKSTVDDKDKVKVAKRIAKDMEKWAKTLNHKKEVAKMNIVAQATPLLTSNAAADIGYAVLGSRKDALTTSSSSISNNTMFLCAAAAAKNESASSNVLGGGANKSDSLVPDYGRGSDSEEEQPNNYSEETTIQQILDKLVDWNKIACLLCKRQFPNKDTLTKHQQLSDLHRQNLESYCKSMDIDTNDSLYGQLQLQQQHQQSGDSGSISSISQSQYRDRAKERRIRHNEPDNPRPSRLKETYLKTKNTVNYEQPTVTKIGGDNLGNKLLQKMGWQEGMGLGKSNQGRTDIIQAQTRPISAGLGSRSQGVTPAPGETYKECVKKMMRHRYEEIDSS